jgi:hypothetical protein
VNNDPLKNELRRLNSDLDAVLSAMTEQAHEMGIRRVQDMRVNDGSWAVTPILLAKAQVLNALATLAKP